MTTTSSTKTTKLIKTTTQSAISSTALRTVQQAALKLTTQITTTSKSPVKPKVTKYTALYATPPFTVAALTVCSTSAHCHIKNNVTMYTQHSMHDIDVCTPHSSFSVLDNKEIKFKTFMFRLFLALFFTTHIYYKFITYQPIIFLKYALNAKTSSQPNHMLDAPA